MAHEESSQENALKRADMESLIKKAHDVVAAYGEVLERKTSLELCFILRPTCPLPKQK
jgi:hypothetical protein